MSKNTEVQFKHSDYLKHVKTWDLVDDTVEGHVAIKAKGQTYLPMPISFGAKSDQRAKAHYKEYLSRAVFSSVTGQTVASLIGMAFMKLPNFTAPDSLDYMKKNADGAGRSIYQVSQMMTRLVLKNYRCGVYVDYPQGKQARTLAEQKALKAFPTISVIPAAKIINWDSQVVDNTVVLSLVVIEEDVSVLAANGFTRQNLKQYRVLRLVNGLYCVQLFTPNQTEGGFDVSDPIFPTDYNNNYWTFIPFSFCGAIDNSAHIFSPPMLELAVLNLAHYRNSADVEESSFMVGQPMFCMPNLDVAKLKAMKEAGEGLEISSSRVIQHDIKVVQASENNLAKANMSEKWQQMKELGARLIESGSANRTATEASQNNRIQHSVLSLVVSNVSESLQMALQWCAKYATGDAESLSFDDLTYEVATDFNVVTINNEQAKRLYDAAMANIIPMEVWYHFEQNGTLPESTWLEIQEKLELEQASMPSRYMNAGGYGSGAGFNE